ncbi:MAG: BrnT family toxin [Desulfamplus sp.]|nr:BrnT family toxin [Desulfamplus sp.]
MEYEWDENKREINLKKHGFDFVIAYRIYESNEKLTVPSGYINEQRWIDIAPVGEELLIVTMVYTYREKSVRVISLRKANRKERSLYYDKKRNCQVQ